MNQSERRIFLIEKLLKESSKDKITAIPKNEIEQKQLLRALINVRMPTPISEEFILVQDEYLKHETESRGVIKLSDLSEVSSNTYLWRGDITTLQCGAIVNAANSGMTGCYRPCHNCIDNCIHTYAGVQLRNYCNNMTKHQGHAESAGGAKITPAYNLPCDYVIHTVGPIVQGPLTEQHCKVLKACYQSCLEVADKNKITSIAFCCISTGVFMFPNKKAAEIAITTVRNYKAETGSKIEVIYNVFKEEDEHIYRELLR